MRPTFFFSSDAVFWHFRIYRTHFLYRVFESLEKKPLIGKSIIYQIVSITIFRVRGFFWRVTIIFNRNNVLQILQFIKVASGREITPKKCRTRRPKKSELNSFFLIIHPTFSKKNCRAFLNMKNTPYPTFRKKHWENRPRG